MRNSYLMNSLFNCAVAGNTLKSFHTFTKKKNKKQKKAKKNVYSMLDGSYKDDQRLYMLFHVNS